MDGWRGLRLSWASLVAMDEPTAAEFKNLGDEEAHVGLHTRCWAVIARRADCIPMPLTHHEDGNAQLDHRDVVGPVQPPRHQNPASHTPEEASRMQQS